MHANRGPAKCPSTEKMNGRGVKDSLGENRETKEKKKVINDLLLFWSFMC